MTFEQKLAQPVRQSQLRKRLSQKAKRLSDEEETIYIIGNTS
jgi:hypothetical protein